MAITNISVLRKNLFSSIDNVIEYNDSIIVNTKKGNAVIISEAEYNAMLETIYLVSQKGLVEKIKEGEKEDISSMSTFNPNEEWWFMWIIKFTKNAEKDKKLLKSAGLEEKAKKLLILIANNPFATPPSYEKLVGDLEGCYSRRINIQHKLVYKVYKELNTVVVHSMWSHYGDN